MNTFVRDYEYTSRRPVGTPGGASSTAASYRQQAATLMAQIKNDMKGQKRIFSGSTETSYADDKVSSFSSSADVSRTKSNPKPSRRLPADPDNLVENVARLSMHDRRSFSSSSLHSSQHRTSSSRTASLSSRPLSTLSTAPSSYPSSSLRTTDDLNRFVSSSTASGTTLTSTSGVPSFVKHAGPPHIRTIAPADIPPVPEVYNGMVYDKVMMKWVRSGRCVSEEPSEDPFGDIESLKDESREREGEHDRQVYPGEMSRIEERSEADDEELNSFSTDEPSAYIVDVMTGVDTFEDTIDSADEDENGGFEQYEAGPPPVVVATPQRTPAIRSAMKSTPLHRADRRSVSFSDGRREGPIQGLDDLTGIVQSARSKRIAQLMEALEEDGFCFFSADSPIKAGDDTVREETHAVAYLIHGETSSVGTSRQVFSRSRITNANATFLTECSFAVSHDRLVEVITDVEPFTPHWDKLGCIDLSGKRLESVARLKEFLPRLESLNVNSNQLGWLSGIPGSVRTLSAASNSLTGLTSYSHLVNLEKLDISRNDVESLKQLGCLRHLRELKADGNKISSIEGLERMGSLVKLSLQGNCIQTVDFSGNSWARLELLNVCGNRLEKMVGLASLQGLVSLNIDNNELGELELDGPMGKLRVLRISGNRLCELCVGMMRNLRTLYADNNSLTSVVKVEELTKLENLSLRNQSGRGLKIMTREVRDVKRLYLSGNALEEGFLNSACYNLQYLEVAGCRLRRLPSDMGRLVPNLRALNLNYNFVEEVGGLEGLGRLRKLSMIGSRNEPVHAGMVHAGAGGGRAGPQVSAGFAGRGVPGAAGVPGTGDGGVWATAGAGWGVGDGKGKGQGPGTDVHKCLDDQLSHHKTARRRLGCIDPMPTEQTVRSPQLNEYNVAQLQYALCVGSPAARARTDPPCSDKHAVFDLSPSPDAIRIEPDYDARRMSSWPLSSEDEAQRNTRVDRVRTYPSNLTWSVKENIDADLFSKVSKETLGVYPGALR
ncbi:Septation initiation network scaffold protein cdc11 [Termitomyces sp. J132]|nr:Septation initiation network scaffold protein cdc11 [Termitomyces sp. J132]